MPLTGTYHQIDGVRVYCTESGQGEPLLLLHDFLLSQRSWEPVAEALGRHFTLIAVDLPGFGESDRPGAYAYTVDAFAGTVAGLMDTLGVTQARVAGHGLGAAVALALAAWYPERFVRLVVVAPACRSTALPSMAWAALLPVVGEAYFLRVFSRRDLRAYLRRQVYLDPALPGEETLQFYWERLNRPGGRLAALRTLRALRRLQEIQRPLPGRVQAPVRLVVGEADRLCPMGSCRRLQLELREASLVGLPGTAHAPMEERPDAFVAAVVPFLRGEPEAAGVTP